MYALLIEKRKPATRNTEKLVLYHESNPISTATIEQLEVNQQARRARHIRVFARAAFLRWPSFSLLSGIGLVKGRAKSRLFGHAEVHHYTSPSHKLFTRYGAMVALLFFVGSFTPSNAYSDGSIAAGDLGGYWDDAGAVTDSAIMTDQEGYLTKINPQTSVGDRSTMSDFLVHTVSSGETVSTIAASYGVRTNTVRWANNMAGDNLKIDQRLLIPPVDGVYHQISKKDSIEKIAKSYGVSSENILKQNSLTAASPLTIGDEIFIPGGRPLVADVPVGRDTPARVASTGRVNSVTSGGAILEGTNDIPIGDKPFIFPTRGKITQSFHAGHYAFDIGNADRPAIWAAGNGTVVKVVSGCADVSYRCGGGYGNHVIIDHGNGLQTLYAHMTYPSVQVGDRVSQGQVIGKMGRSGNVRGRTGIHLHFEVHKNGVKQLPSKYY